MIKYDRSIIHYSRQLRKNSTLGEVILWSRALRAKKMRGYQFNRQMPLSISSNKRIIVDFICRKLKLIIEIDGYSHIFKFEEDSERDKILKEKGYTILRFSEREVRKNTDEVIRIIENTIDELENFL